MKTLAPPQTEGRRPEVTQLALSPDGTQLAAGHSDGTIRLWSLESGEAEPPAPGHRTGVSCLRYSRGGALLASGGQDTDVVVWDVTSGIPLHRLQGHLGQVTALVRIPNLASGSAPTRPVLLHLNMSWPEFTLHALPCNI